MSLYALALGIFGSGAFRRRVAARRFYNLYTWMAFSSMVAE
jgi:hypothetical protein